MHLPLVQRLGVVLGGGILLGVLVFLLAGGVALSVDADPNHAAPVQPATPFETRPPRPSAPPTSVAAPTTSPPATTPSRGTLVIHGAGDVNTDSSYHTALRSTGHAHAWERVRPLFTDDDLTVVNLECTPSPLGDALPKEFVFRCDRESLPVMARAGVEVVNLANNHSRDHGPAALLDGVDRVRAAGLQPVGVGADAASAARPAVFEVDGWTVAVLGFGGVVPAPDWVASTNRAGMADGDDAEAMAKAVTAAAETADIVVVSIHWGVELDTEPRPEDRRRAEALIEAGADVILGHHSHRLQPLETIDGAVVAWGLGNFVWPAASEAAATTAVARVIVAGDGTVRACLVPVEIDSAGRPEPLPDTRC